MFKTIALSLVLICSRIFVENNNITIDKYCYICDNIYIVYDNYRYELNTKEANTIKLSLMEMCRNSHEMPAFGVSINAETINALKSGTWVIFKYPATQSHCDMPFDELLIQVSAEYSGFNIFRGNNGIYEGRCYYLSLDNDMSKLSETIADIIKTKTTSINERSFL